MLSYFLFRIADIDIKTRQIPDEYSLIICILALGRGGFSFTTISLALAVLCFSSLIMGFGDAKLFGALTLFFKTGILSIFIASFMLAGIYCIIALLGKEIELKGSIAFAPFIAISSLSYWFLELIYHF